MTTRWITRPETADDVSAIREVNLAAFRPPPKPSWLRRCGPTRLG